MLTKYIEVFTLIFKKKTVVIDTIVTKKCAVQLRLTVKHNTTFRNDHYFTVNKVQV